MSLSACLLRVPKVVWRWRLMMFGALVCSLLLLIYLQTGAVVSQSLVRPRHMDQSVPRVDSLLAVAATRAVTSGRDHPPPGPRYNEDGTRRAHPYDNPLPQSAGDGDDRRPQSAGDEQPVYVPLARVVHLDLKGAPPTVSYLTRLMRLVRQLGATGLLLEWEDMLPYSGSLAAASATNHYSRQQVRDVLDEAARLQLEVIPLVQTFGHLESVLKLAQFAPLREDPAQPAALCPSQNSSRRLVRLLVDQVMALHPAARRLHIGCDEVFQLGVCRRCRDQQRDQLYLQHVVHVAEYVRRRHGVTPLVWDDMMRQIPVSTLNESGIGRLVEPVVWVYAEDVYRFVQHETYDAFSKVFPTVWGASAYKGAFGETLVVPPLRRHLDNTLNWLDMMRREADAFEFGFRGLVLTGWQRYDHFAVLCELLPAAIPSLALTLATASRGYFNDSLREPVFRALGCSVPAHEPFLNLDDDPTGYFPFSYCKFPGVEFFKVASRYADTMVSVNEFIRSTTESKGWLTEYNVLHNFSSPFRVDELMEMYYSSRFALTSLTSAARVALRDIVDQHTIAEWLEQRVLPPMKQLQRLRQQGDALKRRSVWPRRPLPASDQLFSLGVLSPPLTESEEQGVAVVPEDDQGVLKEQQGVPVGPVDEQGVPVVLKEQQGLAVLPENAIVKSGFALEEQPPPKPQSMVQDHVDIT